MRVIKDNGGGASGPCSIHLKGEEANKLDHAKVRDIVDRWCEMMEQSSRPVLRSGQFDIGGNTFQIDASREDLNDNRIILKMIKSRPKPVTISFKVQYAFSITAEAHRKKDEGMPWWKRFTG